MGEHLVVCFKIKMSLYICQDSRWLAKADLCTILLCTSISLLDSQSSGDGLQSRCVCTSLYVALTMCVGHQRLGVEAALDQERSWTSWISSPKSWDRKILSRRRAHNCGHLPSASGTAVFLWNIPNDTRMRRLILQIVAFSPPLCHQVKGMKEPYSSTLKGLGIRLNSKKYHKHATATLTCLHVMFLLTNAQQMSSIK